MEQLIDVPIPAPDKLPPMPKFVAVCCCQDKRSGHMFWDHDIADSGEEAVASLTLHYSEDRAPAIPGTIRVGCFPDKIWTEAAVREAATRFIVDWASKTPNNFAGMNPSDLCDFARILLGELPAESTPVYSDVVKLAASHPPPQSWHDETVDPFKEDKPCPT